MMDRIGIVGVGRMGLAMARHLIKAGYSVTACDLDPSQLSQAREAGARIATTPKEMAAAADFVILGVVV
jgi:3-hydroxyisobutyrate dehydrogenase-like beta-hydroxyacid dehydrogenase